MTNLPRSTFILSALMMATFATYAHATEATPPTVPSAERMILTSVTASVTAIDQEKRLITLTGPLGNVVTFVIDERVQRLNEVQVGDNVTADYYVSLAGELRAATDEEKQTPLVIVAGTTKAPKGTSPAGGVLHAFKVVATVIGLDLPSQTVTLQGPRGNMGVIRAEKLENLVKLRLGDTIVVTYTEALAISLVKTPAAAK